MPRFQGFALLCLLLYFFIASQMVMAKTTVLPADTSASSILPGGNSGTAVLDDLVKHVDTLGAYKYDASQEAHKGRKVVRASGTFYFKPVRAVRMEVKDYGSKSGCIIVRSPDGKIRGKGGPQMWGIKMTLEPDSRLLRLPNGLNVIESDLASLYNRLQKQAASGCKIVYAHQPIRVKSVGTPVIVLESQEAGGSGAAVLDRVFIDPSRKVPLQWDQFEKGNFLSRSKFNNYQVNARWDDSKFKL